MLVQVSGGGPAAKGFAWVTPERLCYAISCDAATM